jgi:hypothetical protein
MKKIYKLIFILVIPSIILAVPAYKGDITFKQADKSTFTAKLKGDEWFSWIEDKKGNIITFNKKTKNYELGMIKTINGNLELVPSGIKVSNNINTSSTIKNIKPIDRNILKQIWISKKSKALLHH